MNLNISKNEKINILNEFEKYIKDKTKYHFGYPYNLKFNYKELSKFFKYSINNLGDPFQESNYGVHSRKFELEILEFFSKLWKINSYWGYVTNSGTEGNLQAILVARENFPDGILYSSEESHYSVFKAAHFYRIPVKLIKTNINGSICIQSLEKEIINNIDKPIIININIGTTVKGAVDDLDEILLLLNKLNIPRNKYFIHCDGALFAMILQFLNKNKYLTINFEKNIDSIAISGHKFLGCPMPCGVFLTRKYLMDKLMTPIEYLNSVDSTITGSRNGLSSLFIWNTLMNKKIEGLQKDARKVMKNSNYLLKELKKRNLSCFKNKLSSTIIFEKPNQEFIKKWQLACINNIAHVVVMPSINKNKIDLFLEDIDKNIDNFNHICVSDDIINCCCKTCNQK